MLHVLLTGFPEVQLQRFFLHFDSERRLIVLFVWLRKFFSFLIPNLTGMKAVQGEVTILGLEKDRVLFPEFLHFQEILLSHWPISTIRVKFPMGHLLFKHLSKFVQASDGVELELRAVQDN